MPIFEYKCQDCEYKFELLQSKVMETSCPNCNGKSKVVFSVYAAPGTVKQWLGKTQVNFGVDSPKHEIEKQLAAASKAGKFGSDVRPDIRRERIVVGEEALRNAGN